MKYHLIRTEPDGRSATFLVFKTIEEARHKMAELQKIGLFHIETRDPNGNTLSEEGRF